MEKCDEKLVEFFSKDEPFADAFECLFDDASDAIYILDKFGNFVTVNREAEELTGFKREDFIGKSFRNIISLKSLPKAIKGFLDVIRGKEVRLELELKTAAKKTVLVEVTSKPLIVKGKVVGTVGIARDISERALMEKRLRETNKKLEMILETATEGIAIVDAKENITFLNKAFADLLGYDENELIHINLRKLVDKEGFKEIRRQTETRKKGNVSRYELVMYGKDGKPRIVQVSASPLWNEDGQFAGSLAIVMDVTERKRMEEALRESEEKWRSLAKNAPNVILIVDRDGKIQFINRTVIDASPEQMIGKSIYDFIDPRYQDVVRKTIGHVFQTGEGGSYEISGTGPEGGTSWYATQVGPIKRDGQTVSVTLITVDITERKQMLEKLEEYSQHLEELVEQRTKLLKEAQEQLIKSERLAAIGQVAAMIGHDLRNPLTGISGATYYLKTKLGPRVDEKIKEMLELIENDVEHSNKIIKDLMEYSKEIKLELTKTTLRSIIKETLFLVEIPDDVQLRDLTQNEPKVKIDLEQMKRVFANLIKNAVDAMLNGGKLTIASRESDGNVEITFTDTGTGMTKEVMEKIWTPFFTTKAKGMGLGLPICRRIIEAHGGSISVESTFGKGTTFTVTIPIEPKLEGGEKVWVNLPESLSSTMTKA